MKFLRNEHLSRHTSFKIGGPADYFCTPGSAAEIKEALCFARERSLPVAVLGAGSNLLVLDKGFRGMVIKLGRGKKDLDQIKVKNGIVCAGAGASLPKLVRFLAQTGWGGLEFLAGIPGSVGGAVTMNAGAWGKEIGGYVKNVYALDRAGKEKKLDKRSLGFSYRKSRIQNKKLILTKVVLKLRKKRKNMIKNKVREYLTKRKQHQPLGIPNCGSVFKNPRGDFAGRLIEAAGCKGMRVGDAQVSEKHGNFILNLGEARAGDVIKLIAVVRKKVKERFKITLEPEIKIMVNYERLSS